MYACDRDQTAVTRGLETLRHYIDESRLKLTHENFAKIEYPERHFDAMVFDLGLSSDQVFVK